MSQTPKGSPGRRDQPSKVEVAKENSNYLRGTIREALENDQPKFGPHDSELLKFHGAYQQYDRDHRKQAGAGATERRYQMMVRLRIPGGQLTAEQYLGIDQAARELSSGSLRFTTRQGIQLHGVLKHNLKATISRINGTLLTTRGACGDGCRNVMTCPAPATNGFQAQLAAYTEKIANEMASKTHAYYEIWLDEEKIVSTKPEEPFYGRIYLPRKFKAAIAMSGDNCVDVYTQDVGMIPVVEDGEVRGVNLVVGGGLGMTHTKADTFARLASPLGRVDPEHITEAVKTIAAIFRDYGNRGDRRHARLKYLIHEKGMDWFRGKFESQVAFELKPATDLDRMDCIDHLGNHQQQDGKYFYGLNVDNGRVQDNDKSQLQTGLRAVVEELRPRIALTPQQNILFIDLSPAQVDRLLNILDDHGITRSERVSAARRVSLACPAFPTCGLAITESERVMPQVMDQFERGLAGLGLADERLSVRMTGCPNGCTRPYSADIGIVGRTATTYDIYVGGRLAGDRLAKLSAEKVPLNEVLQKLHPLLLEWKKSRRAGEAFGDYHDRVHRTGPPMQILTGAKLVEKEAENRPQSI